MLSLSGNWLFVHVPKTGGNSIQSVLVEYSDDWLTVDQYRDGVDEFEVSGPYTDRKHTTLQDYHDRLDPETFRRLVKFAVVRDPWERAVSAYFSPISWVTSADPPAWSRERFCRMIETELLPMTDLVTVSGVVGLDLLLRFERLPEEAPVLFSRLGYPTLALPHRNKSVDARPWREYYERDPALIDLVGEIYAKDVEAFGYRYEATAPRS